MGYKDEEKQQPVAVLENCVSLDNTVDPLGIPAGTPAHKLASAVNIRITDSNKVESAEGITLLQAATFGFHSAFCDKGLPLVIQEQTSDAALLYANSDLSLTGLRSGLTKNRRMAYAQANDTIFYANGIQNGIVKGGASDLWPVDSYNGPDSDMSFTSAPVGTHLGHKHGMIFIAVGDTVYNNLLPFVYGLFNLKQGFVIPESGSDVTMVRPNESGVFMSSAKSIWYFEGDSAATFTKQRKVYDVPAIEWSDSPNAIPAAHLGLQMEGDCYIWTTSLGHCAGLPNGSVLNLTEQHLKFYENYISGATAIVDNNYIISTLI